MARTTPSEERRGPLLPGLARNAGTQFAARVVGAGVQAVGLIVVARTLGPGEYGGFALVSTLTLMATVLADWGVLLVGARRAATHPGDRTRILRACLSLRLGLGVLAAIALVGLSFVGSDRSSVHVAALVAAASFLPGAWLAVGAILAQLDLRMERVAAGQVAGSIASMAWLLTALALDGGIVALSGSFVANAVVATAVTLAMSPRPLPLRPGRDHALNRSLLRESNPVGLSLMLVTVYFYVDAVLLSRISSSTQLGYYDAAYRFVQVGTMVPSVVATSLFTVMAGLAKEDRRRLAALVRELTSVIAVFVPLPLVALATAPQALMAFFYGDAYRPGGTPLAILALAVALIFLSGTIGPLLVSLGRERTMLRISVAATIVNLTVNAVLIPLYAARGAAAATVVTELVVLTPAAVVLWRELHPRLDAAQLAKVAVAGVAGAAVVLLVPGPVLVRIALGLAAYVGLLVATGGLTRELLNSTRTASAVA